jgi:hypothetical protein
LRTLRNIRFGSISFYIFSFVFEPTPTPRYRGAGSPGRGFLKPFITQSLLHPFSPSISTFIDIIKIPIFANQIIKTF